MSAIPVIFIHGLWLHSSSWQPWIDHFTAAGFDATAPGWPGDKDSVEETRENPAGLAGLTIEAVTAHYAELISKFEVKPIVIGHSFGGLIAQKLLASGHARAVVAIDPAGIKGVKPLPLSQLRSAWPVLSNPGNSKKAISLTARQFRYGFGNALPQHESDGLFEKFAIPAPGKFLFQAASANLSATSEAAVDTTITDRGPLLFIAGGLDHNAPEVVVRAAAELYAGSTARTDLEVFPDRGHSLVIDSGWEDIATASVRWIESFTETRRA
jgi:pimeloyl-ACP methyl ester carboxylesterase